MLNYEAIKEEKLYGLVQGVELADMVRDVASYNGHLADYEAYNMEELPDLLGGMDTMTLLRKVYYGDFRPHDDYFYFNGYDNLVSCTEYEYYSELEGHDDEIIDEFMDLYTNDASFASWASFDLSDYVTDEEMEQYEIED